MDRIGIVYHRAVDAKRYLVASLMINDRKRGSVRKRNPSRERNSREARMFQCARLPASESSALRRRRCATRYVRIYQNFVRHWEDSRPDAYCVKSLIPCRSKDRCLPATLRGGVCRIAPRKVICIPKPIVSSDGIVVLSFARRNEHRAWFPTRERHVVIGNTIEAVAS